MAQLNQNSFKTSRAFFFVLIIGILIVAVVAKEQNYYEILGVKKNATEKELRSAFKKLAVIYHPDKIKESENKEDAEKKFAEIANAYETLKDPKTREEYDNELMYGKPRNGGQRGQRQEYGGHGNFDSFFNSFFGGGGGGGGGANFDMGDMFGGGMGGDPRQQQQEANVFEGTSVEEYDKETITNFFSRQEAILLMFYHPSVFQKDERLAKTFIKLAEKKSEAFKLGAINCMAQKKICEQDFKINLRGGQYKILGFPLRGGLKSAQEFAEKVNMNSLNKFILSLVKADVVTLTEENFFTVCDVKKKVIILFTDKPAVPPLFSAVANLFETKFVFAVLNVTKHPQLYKKFGHTVTKTPSIMALSDPYNYQGKVHSSHFKKEQISTFLRNLTGSQDTKFVEFTKQMNSTGEICGAKDSKICLIFNIQNDIKLLDHYKTIPQKFIKEPIRFLFVRSGFGDLLQGEAGYVLIKGKRQRYVAAKATEQPLDNFINSVLDGSVTFKQQSSNICNTIQFS